jgi:peptidoglycan/xylan/chitin deacetylase (PgdA/CDA1 family)
MYHYVRDLNNSRYPDIKGLHVDLFREQVSFLKKHYHPISAYTLMDCVAAGEDLPPRAALLTFDDGYVDHFTDVFPVLDKEGISGCFFPPAKCILENAILDVNKIHFILASVPDKSILVDFIHKAIDEYRDEYGLASNASYWEKCATPSRYDPAEVVFIKSMLQRELPENMRSLLLGDLFRKFVSHDSKAFAQELYMSTEQICCLQRNGMYVGSHGYDHYWLNSLSEDKQRREIDLSLEFLTSVGSETNRWIMCYPYGAYNDTTLSILRERNCSIGLTGHPFTEVGIADLKGDHLLTLPRLDTNDLPKDSQAAPNEWTIKVMNG